MATGEEYAEKVLKGIRESRQYKEVDLKSLEQQWQEIVTDLSNYESLVFKKSPGQGAILDYSNPLDEPIAKPITVVEIVESRQLHLEKSIDIGTTLLDDRRRTVRFSTPVNTLILTEKKACPITWRLLGIEISQELVARCMHFCFKLDEQIPQLDRNIQVLEEAHSGYSEIQGLIGVDRSAEDQEAVMRLRMALNKIRDSLKRQLEMRDVTTKCRAAFPTTYNPRRYQHEV